jgi:hypothetical protein
MLLWALTVTTCGEAPDSSAQTPRPIRRVASGISGRWIGQDGHDLVGSPSSGPNDVQDIHFVLSNLPPDREVVFLRILADGSGGWQFDGKTKQPWTARIVRAPGSREADVYLEPIDRKWARAFAVQVRLSDGSQSEFRMRGGEVDENLRMPGTALAVRWVGQNREDWTGPGAAVGPDGAQDARLALTRLSKEVKLRLVEIVASAGGRWHYGMNPKREANAELFRDEKDPTRADLYFQPDRDLKGTTLDVTVEYESGKKDRAKVVAGRTDPKLPMPRLALPTIGSIAVRSEWLGQDGGRVIGPGEVHVALSGLPVGKSIIGAVLSDSVRGCWLYRQDDRVKGATAEPEPRPLALRRGPDRSRADLYFVPYRDESGATMTLRLVYGDGGSAVAQFPGGRCDPGRRAPTPAATSVVARPGDDLNDLANRFGTVRLSKGTYPLTAPLVLNNPVTLAGEAGARLVFTQKAGDAPWTTAIKIHRGGTTLSGFAVRFTGPVRWNWEVSYGPAVIGLTDSLDGRTAPDPKIGLTFTGLDLESPPSANPATWEEASRLFRLVGAEGGGRIEANSLRGGPIEFFGGPWQVLNNDFRGTPAGTFSYGAVAAHDPHDLVVRGNRTRALGPSGKTWRFLVMTNSGYRDRVEENRVEEVGPRDNDTIPSANAPEIILTESYRLSFEGRPSAVSPDGRVVRVLRTHGLQPGTGSVVAVVSGPHAGQWRRVAEAVGPTTFLLESPLPAGSDTILITRGFVEELFQKNLVDARGSRDSLNLNLGGNHFGTRVLDNHLLGGGETLWVRAYPTESPGIWGWSHVPILGAVVEGNTIEDSERGGNAEVLHKSPTKTSRGRVYMTLSLRNNTVRWSEAFLAERRRKGARELPPALTVGDDLVEPGELVAEASGNRLEVPSGVRAPSALRVQAALINGRTVVGQAFELPTGAAPPAASVTRKEERAPRGSR